MLGLCTVAVAEAQVQLGQDGKGGVLAGSFETNSIYYVDDSTLGLEPDADLREYIGSNSYLKLDYTLDRFSAGVQGDLFLPALQGYEVGDSRYDKNGKRELQYYLSSIYAQWQDQNYGIRLGSIFDQFGNGLIFRSFEDRQLGLNNSLLGLHARYSLGRYFTVKAMAGVPRLYMFGDDTASWFQRQYAESLIGGADLSLSLSDMIGAERLNLSLEGSYVIRHEALDKNYNGVDGVAIFGVKNFKEENLHMYSARVNMDYEGFSLRGEYVHKSSDLSSQVAQKPQTGYAALLELGYNYKSFSISGQARVLDNMGTVLSLYGTGTGNTLNYLPALTRQYTYMLANLEPYRVNPEGEIGGQVDVYYSYRSKINRRRYWNFHANFSTFYTLDDTSNPTGSRELLWRDLNFDVERQWSKSWKTTLLYSYQEWNPFHGAQHRTYVANVFVADVTYKINRKHSLRAEAQYLLTNEYQGDWVAGLLEYSFAPSWSFYFQGMYNLDQYPAHDKPLDSVTKEPLKVFYYNGGFSYTHGRTRVQLSYGRNRAGYICSGGVCRYTPAYTGVNLALTTSF